LSESQFSTLFQTAEKASPQLSRFISYLETHPQSHRLKEDSSEYEI
jgi:hypothetical protein